MLQTVVAICHALLPFHLLRRPAEGGGTVWYAMTGLSPFWCLLLSVFVAWLYMVLGGYVGNQWAMALQGLVFAIVGALLGIWAIIYAGGFAAITAKLARPENPKLMTLIRPELPQLGSTQLMSSLVGILATPVIFFTMAVGFPHNVSRFLGMKKMTKKDYWLLIAIVWLFTGIPIMLDCSSNGLVAQDASTARTFSRSSPGRATSPRPCLPMPSAGSADARRLRGRPLLGGPVDPGRHGLHHERQRHPGRDQALVAAGPPTRSMLYLGYFLIALFLFLPFYWTLKRPPELLSIFMGMAAMGLGAIFFFVTAISYYWKRATKWGAVARWSTGRWRRSTGATRFSSRRRSAWERWSGSSSSAAPRSISA